jgi:hypothetical protein
VWSGALATSRFFPFAFSPILSNTCSKAGHLLFGHGQVILESNQNLL